MATFTFDPGTGPITLNNCLSWTSGSGAVNPFIFVAQVGVALSTNIDSNAITVVGNDYPVAISVTGGMYSINGGAFTSSAGTVSAGDLVVARVASSGVHMTATSATVTIDGQSSTFTVTTAGTGNYSVTADLGFDIDAIVDGTATGTPIAYATAIIHNATLIEPYTAITAGTVTVTIAGTGILPTTGLYLFVNGVQVDRQALTVAGSYVLTFPAPVTDPTSITITIQP